LKPFTVIQELVLPTTIPAKCWGARGAEKGKDPIKGRKLLI
jgi:hypothetical protein